MRVKFGKTFPHSLFVNGRESESDLDTFVTVASSLGINRINLFFIQTYL